jgi:Activator of Hsp90 ATPase homolog 1-like protein
MKASSRDEQKLNQSNYMKIPFSGGCACGATLKKVSCGTELNVVQEGVPAVISTDACYLGWQESLTLLANLVEVEIPDA